MKQPVTWTTRPIEQSDYAAFLAALELPFHTTHADDDAEAFRKTIEWERTVAVFDRSEIVGTTVAYGFDLSVPGGALVGAAGVTAVAVIPTHRRRGVLSAMMLAQLRDAADRGEAATMLFSSESGIYGRFGYAPGAPWAMLEIDRRHARLGRLPEIPGRVRMVDVDRGREALMDVYRDLIPVQPGAVRVPDAVAAYRLSDFERWRDGWTADRYVVYEEDGRVLGCLRFKVKSSWKDSHPAGALRVHDLFALTPAAYAALWQFAFGVDLVTTITTWSRPASEPLSWMLAEPRRLRRTLDEGLWLRLLDVPAALAARRYACEGRLTLGIDDAVLDRGGTFELEGGPEGASCRSVRQEPGLRMGIETLAARYLGAHTFTELAAAGLVEGDPELLARADAMFSWHVVPWCPIGF